MKYLILFLYALTTAYADYHPLKETGFLKKIVSGFEGGYEDFSLGQDEFLILYHAADVDTDDAISHPFTSKRVLKLNVDVKALKRAGEVARENGYPYFKILEKDCGEYRQGTKYTQCGSFPMYTYLSSLKIRGLRYQIEDGEYDSNEAADWICK